jgi:NAD(P)-dependent dehydrogenase (short-subunit alcohol dehydrogenase family)
MKYENKTCVVTGGANGIGRCIADAFLREGARVAVIDIDDLSGQKMAQQHGGRLLFYSGNIADKDMLEHFAHDVLAAFGSVDYLINNAMASRRGILSGCSYDDFNEVLRIGITAPYYLTSLFADHFSSGAAVVNIASTRAAMSQPDTESYTAAKGGISALTHALCLSLSGKVRVNSVSPGWVDTGAYQHADSDSPHHSPADRAQHPSGRVGTPEDIASMVLYLCSADAGFINGENITVDGGMSKQMIYHGDHGWAYRPE